ncbi:zinc finger CCHC domain-containing protein 3 [Camelus ferus]|nr:zinc finger CCHC domain-containing protein 3 [Camelus ferus]
MVSEPPTPALALLDLPEPGTGGLWSKSQRGSVWKELERTPIIPSPWGCKRQTFAAETGDGSRIRKRSYYGHKPTRSGRTRGKSSLERNGQGEGGAKTAGGHLARTSRGKGDEGACPTRDFVVGALILRSIGMDPSDIYAVIQIPGSREFDVSFRSAEKLALFLRVYEEKREQEDCWENFVVLGRSKSSLKTLFILFRNETVDVEDIVTWLKRHCDVLAVPVKVTDRFGIWTGEYKCEIELRQGEGGVRHLPGAFFLGAERGYSWYKGQPKTCFKCGSRTHMSGSCTQDRCFRCGEEGHLSPYCRKGIVCNLCGKRGHAFAQCPKAVHNSVAAQLTGVAGH